MKASKKILSLLLTLAMLMALVIPAFAAGIETTNLSGAVVMIHTNDVHGAIGGYAKVAALKKEYEAKGAYVLLVDDGDFIQGAAVVSASLGSSAVELMNMAGYNISALGNHEFDYGYANLVELSKQANFPFVAANVLYNGSVAFNSNKIFTAPDGTKIGFFGLDTPETATKAHPAKIQGVTFLAGNEMFSCAKSQVSALEAAGCDVIVCLGHLGIDEESAGNRSTDLLKAVSGIDVFIDGHSHSDLSAIASATDGTCKVGNTLLTSTGTAFANVGVVVYKDGIASAYNIPIAELTASDETVAAKATALQAAIDAEYGTVFAKTEVALNGERDPGNRTQETNLGNLITDALLWGARQEGESVDAAITNGGGIRATIAAGNITKKDVNTVLPFGNTLNIIKLTGAELLEALEASTYSTPTAVGGFPQVSGIKFTINTTVPFDQGTQYPGSTYYAPANIKRVSIESVGGKPFQLTDTYTIATNDFTAAGGDTYYAFSACSVNYDLGIPMDEVVMDYIKTELNGVVTAAKYGKPAGNITIKQSAGIPFTDVTSGSWYYDAVCYAYENDLFVGTSATTFSPSMQMSRSMVATVLYRLAEEADVAPSSNFSDVTRNMWYTDAIDWAAAKNIVKGLGNGRFGVNMNVSRQELAVMLYRMAGSPKTSASLSAYSDQGTVATWAKDAMSWAVQTGVITGTDSGKLAPTGNASRAEVAVILMRYAQLG